MRFLISILAVFSFGLHLSYAQIPKLSEDSKISLLTCAAGNELYYAFGHSAFRVQDNAIGLDVVYNYGTFDFNQPNFYLNFVKGKMVYSLTRRTFERFLFEYEMEKRWVKEQVFDLTLEEKNELLAFFENNYLPENREYLYDPLYDNCSTITGDVLKEQFGDRLQFNGSHLKNKFTFRQLVRKHLNINSWSSFGIDLTFGSTTDRQATVRQHMFAPYFAMRQMRNTTLDNRPLLERERTVLDYGEHSRNGFFPASPLFWFSLLFFFTAIITYLDNKHKTRSKWLDFSIFFITGLVGIFLCFLWFGTDHVYTVNNFNVLWAFPLNLGVAFVLIWNARLPEWIPKYIYAVLGLLGLTILFWIFQIQIFSPINSLLFAILATRYWYLLRCIKLKY